MDLGPHAAFIWLCYGITVAVIAGMIVWLWQDGNRLKSQLARIEQQSLDKSGTPDG